MRLVGLSLLPVVLATVGLVASIVQAQRDAFHDALVERARVLMLAIESDVQRVAAIVETLEASPLLDAADLAGFHSYAQRVLAGHPGTRLALVGPAGDVLLSTALPIGKVLPNVLDVPAQSDNGDQARRQAADNAAVWREVFSSQRAVYSNVFRGAIANDESVAVRYPVTREGKVKYGLALAFPTSTFDSLLVSAGNPDWAARLIDRRGATIARSPRAERFYGDPLTPAVPVLAADRSNAVQSGNSVDGVPMVQAVMRSELTGWVLSVAAPATALSDTLGRSMMFWGAAVCLALLLGMLLALRTWRQLSQPLRMLSDNARAFERGEPIHWPRSNIREIEDCSYAWTLALRADEGRRAAERLRIAADSRREEIEEASLEKDRLLAALSHELRNPLGAISNSINVLDRQPATDSRARAMIDIIKRQTSHLSRLVDDLLDVARATFGKMRLDLAPVDLHALAQQTLKLYAQRRGPTPHLSLKGRPAWIRGDATRLDQVLRNLIDNAIKFTLPSGQITVVVEPTQTHAVLSVIDTGSGLNVQEGDDIFEAFVQSEQGIDRAGGGLGLGLALVRQIVELHEGNVRATSPGIDQGTTITVMLPRLDQD